MLQYPLEVPWQGTSNGYHNRVFHAEIRKIICGYPALIWGYKVEKICFWAYIICACLYLTVNMHCLISAHTQSGLGICNYTLKDRFYHVCVQFMSHLKVLA